MNEEGGGSDLKGIYVQPRLPGFLTWEALGAAREVSILRIGYFGSVVVPALAYGIEIWNRAHPALRVALPDDFFITYLGTILLGMGHLLNELCVPRLVKMHGTLQGYEHALAEIAANRNVIFKAGQASAHFIALEKLRSAFSGEVDPAIIERVAEVIGERVAEIDPSLVGPKPEHVITAYAADWEEANQRYVALRILIVFLYVMAAGIVGWLAVSELISVWHARFP